MSNTPTTKLQRLVAGQPLQISASSWNKMAKHCETPDGVNELPLKPSDSNTVILCKNSTGASIPAFRLVSIVDFTPNPTWTASDVYAQRMGMAYTSTPVLSSDISEKSMLGITQSEIPDGEAGYVLISGYSVLAHSKITSLNANNGAYLSPQSQNLLVQTDACAPIKLLQKIGGVYSCLYVQLNPPYEGLYNALDAEGLAEAYDAGGYTNYRINITTKAHRCFVYDGYNEKYFRRDMPALSLTISSNNVYQAIFIRHNLQTAEFELVLNPPDVSNIDWTAYAYVLVGIVNGLRFIPLLHDVPIFIFHPIDADTSPYFNITWGSGSDKWSQVLVSGGFAHIVGMTSTHTYNSTTLTTDSSGSAFVSGNKYVVLAKYDITGGAWSIVAVPWSNTNSSGNVPSTTLAVATIGMFCYRKYIRQWFHGGSLSLNYSFSIPTS